MRCLRPLGYGALLLSLFLAGMWAVSFFRGVRCEFARLGVGFYDGGFAVWFVQAPNVALSGFRTSAITLRSRSWVPRLPMVFSNPREACLFLPLWLCLLVSSATTALLFRAAPKTRPGFCPNCGYDLRATPNRCPECGHQPKPAHS